MNAKRFIWLVAILLFVAFAALGAVDAQSAPVDLTPTAEPPTFTPTATNTAEPTHTPLPTETPQHETATPTPLHPELTPTATPTPGGTIPPWDGAQLSASARCEDNVPTFTIFNDGLSMLLARPFWFLNGEGDASTCADDTAGLPPSGVLQLNQGSSLTLAFPDLAQPPPYRICAQQSLGFPGPGFVAAIIGREGDSCATALDEVAEPIGPARLFFPWAGW